MSTNYRHHGGTRESTSAATPPSPWQRPGGSLAGVRSARDAARACCCCARPVVVAIMPPAAGRSHETELLLCGHHYRVSRAALRAAGARVVDLNGAPVTGYLWQQDRVRA